MSEKNAVRNAQRHNKGREQKERCGANLIFVQEMYLVSDEHDDDVGLGVVAQLLEPPLHVLECDLLGDVVHQQRAHSSSVGQNRGETTMLH